MHWLGPAILPLAILSVVGVLAVTLGTIEGLGRAALSHHRVADQGTIIDIEGSSSSAGLKTAEERQSRAPTAAGLGGKEEEDVEADGASTRARVSFVLDKALDGSGGLGPAAAATAAAKSYHHRLSLSGGTGGFTLARASAAFVEGGKSPPKGVGIGGGEGRGGDGDAVVVQTTYGT